MHVEVWSDFACPWCYIGKRRLEAGVAHLGDQAQVKVIWRSFELGPERPRVPDRTAFEILTQDFGMEAGPLLARFDDIARLGAELDLVLAMTQVRPVNTYDLHRLAYEAVAEGKEDAFLERAFHAYHTERLNVADPAVLTDMARVVGLRHSEISAVLAGDRHGPAVRADQTRAAALGISAVPTLRFEDGSVLSPNSPRLQEALHIGSARLDLIQA